MADKLKVNQRIELKIDKGYYEGEYLSKVAEIDGDHLKVSAPFRKGELVPVRVGQKMDVCYTGTYAAYRFRVEVIERAKNPVALLTLQKLSEVKKIQRRNFFRMEAKVDVMYTPLDEENNAAGELKQTQTIDISGGGVKVVVDEFFPDEGNIQLYLDLPDIGDIPINCEIVRFYDLPDGKAAGLKFIEIDKFTREAIISWLFDYQRLLRQKGLL